MRPDTTSIKEIINIIDTQFMDRAGYQLDVYNPKTFNQKIQWLKLFYNHPLLETCSDKWAVRDFISSVIGDEFLVPAVGVYEDVEKIPFDDLHFPVVFKLTNGSGEVLFWNPEEKDCIVDIKEVLASWLEPGRNHYYYSYEWWYKNLPSRIICEKFLADDIADYKVMCFNGKPRLAYACTERDRELKVTFFDLQWNQLPVRRGFKNSEVPIVPPVTLDEMIRLASRLAEHFPFARIDFYEVGGRPYVGEITFGTGNGMKRFDPVEWDHRLGEYLCLPKTYMIECNGRLFQGSVTHLRDVVEQINLFSTSVLTSRLPSYRCIVDAQDGSALIDIFKAYGAEISKLEQHLVHTPFGARKIDLVRDRGNLSPAVCSGPGKLLVLGRVEGVEQILNDGILNLSSDYDVLFEVRPDTGGNGEDRLSSVIEGLMTHGFRLFAVDDFDSRVYRLKHSVNLAMMESRYKTSSYNVLCLREERALSVAFFSHSSELGGAERSLLDLIRGLTSRGIICNIIMPYRGPLTDKLLACGSGIFIPDESSQMSEGWWWADTAGDLTCDKLSETMDEVEKVLLPELRALAPDVIYSQTIVSPWGAFCAERLGVPHAIAAREYGELDHRLIFALGFDRSMKALYESSEAVFCVTEDVWLTLFAPDTLTKADVVYSGVAIPSHGAELSVNTINQHQEVLTNHKFKIGIFASVAPGKGQLDLIRACILLAKRGRQITCYLAGHVADKSYQTEIQHEIDSSGFADLFVKVGFVESPYALMSQMDLVVSCSVLEAFGRTLIEALILGVPIIYANTGGSSEIFQNGEHGFAYEPGNYSTLASLIENIIENPDAAKARTAQGVKHIAENFSTDAYIQRIAPRLREIARLPRKSESHVNAISDLIGYSRSFRCKPKLYFAGPALDFSEERMIRGCLVNYGLFEQTFELTHDDCICFRLDPIEGKFVFLELFRVTAECVHGQTLNMEDMTITANGVDCKKYAWDFFTLDPQIIIEANHPIRVIRIHAKLLELSTNKINDFIAMRNTQLAERDGQITRLNQILSERDGQIATLNQVLSERDGQIASLNHTVTESHVEIAVLNKAVTERDVEIVNLRDAVCERDGQINFQGQRIQALLQSHSWRWTKPLRFVTSYARLCIRPFRVAINQSSERLPIFQLISIRRIRLSPLFDPEFYEQQNSDVRTARIDPAMHYFLFGWKEHRDPSEHFCTRLYLQNHPDVAASGMNPLLHYIEYGQVEGRNISLAANVTR
jgi:glycosyltransferase involved in cell wall biosynthesis